jgi:hypothetical protein
LSFIFKVYKLNIYVSPRQFSHNLARFWPSWMSYGCYSGAVAAVQWGVAHFENASPYHTFGNEITNSLVPCCQKIQLIKTNQTTVESILENRKFSWKRLKLWPNRSFYRKMYAVQMCLLGHIPPEKYFSGPFGNPELPKISLPSWEWEWELTFFREWDRDRDSRKCLP